jgi:excinuclease ABC subunit C
MAHIRDETHRRAIGFHRKQRESEGLRSRLDDVEGIGPKRKAKLMKAFGSIKEIAKQTPETLAQVAGMSLATAQKLLEIIQ